ncbi:MAG: LysM peptidoglycan-binding domain-containing protein [Anaerovoracaceae bacterium]|nr:LysM peptidoglycan-binding domain-containing protein [Bacillota bacterium]MDY2670472.1 LysM peptidoglycan-binding domain-containing protein [Anaerovoracaceae bacterium]
MKKHYKIVSIPRFTTFIIICTMIVTLAAVSAFSSFHANAETEPVYHEIIVTQGDSLWTIAEDQYGSDTDIRQAVTEIRNVNGLDTAQLYTGQVLKVPEAI